MISSCLWAIKAHTTIALIHASHDILQILHKVSYFKGIDILCIICFHVENKAYNHRLSLHWFDVIIKQLLTLLFLQNYWIILAKGFNIIMVRIKFYPADPVSEMSLDCFA